MLTGKKILIGITGAIAAYKICELIRKFKKENADVKIVMTPNALNFVTKLTLQTLSQNEVFIEEFNIPEWKPEHIALTETDIFVIAPCTANTIGKIANGIADNLLTSTVLAYKQPILIAPSMNNNMWDNKIFQQNLNKLKENDFYIIEPEDGFLACGTNGKGRLANIDTIFEKTIEILDKKKGFLLGKKIVITAGGTKEKIDAVRCITNNSSGKMGEALADFAHNQGADVTLISTTQKDKPYKTILRETAEDMFNEAKNTDYDCILMAAAVSDYRVENISEQKIKKDTNENLTLNLVQNPDILKYLSENKKENQIVVGFCAESENLMENAKTKIQKKGCDFLVANDISRKDIGFNSEDNEIFILDKKLNITKFEKTSKKEIAKNILEFIYGKN